MKISPRHLVWVNLALLALVAYCGASTVSTAIAAHLTLSPEVHLPPPPAPLAREPKRPASYYASIQTRDIFNSAKPEPEKKEPPPPVKTELKLKLWGVVVHTDGSSYCVIEDLTSHKQDLFRINDTVAGSAVVKQIEWDRVILDRDGKDEILDLAPPQGGAAPGGVVPARAAPPGVPPNAAAAAGQPAPGGANPHIRKVSDNQYQIDRSEVDSALDNTTPAPPRKANLPAPSL